MFVEGAVIVENRAMHLFDELWVVTVGKGEQLKRIKERNPGLSDAEIKARLSRQTSDAERLKYADWSVSTEKAFDDNVKLILDRL